MNNRKLTCIIEIFYFHRTSELTQIPTAKPMKQRRKRRTLNPKKVMSYTISRPVTARIEQVSKSETLIKPTEDKKVRKNLGSQFQVILQLFFFKKIFIERKIGDHMDVSDDSSMSSSEILRRFASKKRDNQQENHHGTGDHVAAEIPGNCGDIFQAFGSQRSIILDTQNQVNEHDDDKESISDSSITSVVFRMFPSKREPPQGEAENLPMRSLFTNSSKCVPQNSDVESDE